MMSNIIWTKTMVLGFVSGQMTST